MLVNFWCRHCKINTILIASQKRCPRCGTGMPLDAYYPGTPQLGKDTKSINTINREAPIYGVGTNFGLNRVNSGTRLRSGRRNGPGANN
jgi:hypothetical protein